MKRNYLLDETGHISCTTEFPFDETKPFFDFPDNFMFNNQHLYTIINDEILQEVDPLIELRALAKNRINAECSDIIINGFSSSLHYGIEKKYIMTSDGQYSKQAQMSDLAAALKANTIVAALWKCAEAESEICEIWTKEEFLQFVHDFELFKLQTKIKSDILCDRLKVSATSEELDLISMSSDLSEEESIILNNMISSISGE